MSLLKGAHQLQHDTYDAMGWTLSTAYVICALYAYTQLTLQDLGRRSSIYDQYMHTPAGMKATRQTCFLTL